MPIKPIEVFQFLKPEYKWIAMQEGGYWIAFYTKPNIIVNCWAGHNLNYRKTIAAIDIDYTGDWKDSLFERPKE